MRIALRNPAVPLAALFIAPPYSAYSQPAGLTEGRSATAKDGPAALAIIAKCVASRQPARMAALLHTLPGSIEESEIGAQLAPDMSFCLDPGRLNFAGKSVKFKVRALRDPVSVWMARRENAARPNASVPMKDAPLWITRKLATSSSGSKVDGALWARQDFGHCVAVNAWDDARALLRSEPATVSEKAAVKKLVPVLGPCLDENLKIEMTPDNVRTLVAEPIYHLHVDEVSASSSAKQ